MKLSQLLNKPTPSVSSLAKKYKTTPDAVQAELRRGIQVEMEHTKDTEVAREIALDHLGEDLHYYEKLSNMEKNKVQEQELLELFDLNKPPQGVEGPNLQGTIGGKETYYKFAVDDKKYFVTLYKNRFQHVEIVFSDEQGNVGLTNTGNATKVFWSVAQCLVDYLERHPSVQNIYFTSSSNEPSRIRLYSLLSKRLAQELGWHASSKKPSPPAHPDVDYYVTKEPLRSLDENSLLVELFDLNKVPQGVRPPVYDFHEGNKHYYAFRVDQKRYTCLFADLGDQTYDFKFRDAEKRTSITGAGDAAKVFWGVAKTIDMFVKSHKVKMLKFSASEASRQKLYNVLSKRLAETLGWKREIVTHPSDPATYFRLHNPQYEKQSLDEGRGASVICVDVQPEYSGMNDGDENPVFEQIIHFVNNQTGPVLMFVNAEDQGMTGDTVQDVILYWEDTIIGIDGDLQTNPHPINWNRFQIVDKGYGYFRSWMDQGIRDKTIIKTIRLMYQNKVNDSRKLFGGEDSDDYALNFEQFIGPEFENWMLSDGIFVNWTSVAQLKRFSGSYIVGGGRDECLREVELLMNAFNIKYRRIDSMVYG